MRFPDAAWLVLAAAMLGAAPSCGGSGGDLFGSGGGGVGGAGSPATSGGPSSTGSPTSSAIAGPGPTTTGMGGMATTGVTSGGGTMTTTGPTTTGPTTTGPGTTTAATTTTGGGVYPAPFPAPPQVVDFGGPVIASPTVFPVFFANEDPGVVGPLTSFTQNIGGTPYWTATTSEYGVGPAIGGGAISLAETAPGNIDDTGIQGWLAGKFGTDPKFPAPDANTLIVLYYPAGTTITLQGATSCQQFGGYHSSTQVGNQQVAYAVLPRCNNNLDTVTVAASHELVEAVTDPHPFAQPPTYAQVDEGDFVRQLLLHGGEVGDMCAQFPNVFVKFQPFDYGVQRTWSNKSAAAGNDPCVPLLPNEVYFNAAPVLPDTAPLPLGNQVAMIKAVKIPVGGSRTIDVDLFSAGPTGPWTVGATDISPQQAGPALLGFNWDKTTGQNGDVLHLTIHVLQAGNNNLEGFYLSSQSGNQSAVWFGVVGNQ